MKPHLQKLYEQFAQQNVDLQHRTEALEQSRFQEMVASFSAGAFSLVVVLGALRFSQVSSRRLTGQNVHYVGFTSANENGEMQSLDVQAGAVD